MQPGFTLMLLFVLNVLLSLHFSPMDGAGVLHQCGTGGHLLLFVLLFVLQAVNKQKVLDTETVVLQELT